MRRARLSAIFTASSGQPYSARVGNVDLNNDGNTRNDFAPGTVRNHLSLPKYSSLDNPHRARDRAREASHAAADLRGVQPVERG